MRYITYIVEYLCVLIRTYIFHALHYSYLYYYTRTSLLVQVLQVATSTSSALYMTPICTSSSNQEKRQESEITRPRPVPMYGTNAPHTRDTHDGTPRRLTYTLSYIYPSASLSFSSQLDQNPTQLDHSWRHVLGHLVLGSELGLRNTPKPNRTKSSSRLFTAR